MEPKKILFITRNLPPLVGGMERLHFQILKHLSQEYELAVASPSESLSEFSAHKKVGFKNTSKISFIADSLFKCWQLSKTFQPDLVFSASGATILAARLVAQKFKAPLICQLHGLDIVAPSILYQGLFLPAIRQANSIISISHHTTQLAIEKNIAASKIHLLPPGVDLPSQTNKLTASPFGNERFVLLSVGRLTPRKGLLEFIQNCMPGLVQKHPELLLVIVGSDAEQALNPQNGITEQIKRLSKSLNLEQHIALKGRLSEDELTSTYQHSDLFIFPTLNLAGDAEGFGMVAIEAAAHGLPVMAFANGGVVDAVSHRQSGYLIHDENYRELSTRISEVITGELKFDKVACQAFARQFIWPEYYKKLDKIIATTLANSSQ